MRKPAIASGVGVNWIKFILRQRPIAQSKLHRNIIKSAGREAAIEMPQSRNDHPDNRDLDVGACLVEDEEIKALLLGNPDAGGHLLARAETAELRTAARLDHCIVARRQKWMVLQAKWRRAVEARFFSAPAPHQTDRQKLVQFRERAQQGDAGIIVCARTKLDIFLPVLHPVREGHKGWDRKIAGDVENPKPASGGGKLGLQIADVGIAELLDVHFGPLQAVV